MTAFPRAMAAADVAAEIGLPDGYVRPMSCQPVAPSDIAITPDGTVYGRRIDPSLPREVLGLFGDYEHAEVVLEDGRKIVAARELGQDEWGYFCDAADWVERSNEIMGEIADANDALIAEIEADGEIPDNTSVGRLAAMITKNPLLFALRILNLEAQVRLQHRHLEALEQRIGVRS